MRIQINKIDRESHIKEEEDRVFRRFIAVCCKHCNTEFYGMWTPIKLDYKITDYYDYDTKKPWFWVSPVFSIQAEQEAQKMYEMKKCPFCGGAISLYEKDYDAGYCSNYRNYLGEGNNDCLEITTVFRLKDRHFWIASVSTDMVRGYQKEYWTYSNRKVLPSDIEKRIDSTFEDMKNKREKAEREAAEKKVTENLARWNKPVSDSQDSAAIAIIKQSPKLLIEYLLHLIQLETDIIGLPKRLEELYIKVPHLRGVVSRESYERISKCREEVEKAETKLKRLKKATPKPAKASISKPTQPQEPKPPELKKAGLFNKKIIKAENAMLTANYEQAQKEYVEDLKKYQDEIAQYKIEEEKLKSEAKALHQEKIRAAEEKVKEAKSELERKRTEPEVMTISRQMSEAAEEELQQAETLMQALLKARNELYSYNIVFSKYRDPVALATFYEYLMSGRCEALEGSSGAYNIYEGEIRANTIIAKLSDVLTSLEEIKRNQQMLYKQLCGINVQLGSLNGKMDRAIKSLNSLDKKADVIAYNTERTAFYAKKNAELTDALGYMIALK